jgi:hypothetical protein
MKNTTATVKEMDSKGGLVDVPLDLSRALGITIETEHGHFNVSVRDGMLVVNGVGGGRLVLELQAANWVNIREG